MQRSGREQLNKRDLNRCCVSCSPTYWFGQPKIKDMSSIAANSKSETVMGPAVCKLDEQCCQAEGAQQHFKSHYRNVSQ